MSRRCGRRCCPSTPRHGRGPGRRARRAAPRRGHLARRAVAADPHQPGPACRCADAAPARPPRPGGPARRAGRRARGADHPHRPAHPGAAEHRSGPRLPHRRRRRAPAHLVLRAPEGQAQLYGSWLAVWDDRIAGSTAAKSGRRGRSELSRLPWKPLVASPCRGGVSEVRISGGAALLLRSPGLRRIVLKGVALAIRCLDRAEVVRGLADEPWVSCPELLVGSWLSLGDALSLHRTARLGSRYNFITDIADYWPLPGERVGFT